jgi:hypothetical protein
MKKHVVIFYKLVKKNVLITNQQLIVIFDQL